MLLCVGNSVYRFRADNEQSARGKARQMLTALERSDLALLLVLPLAQGKEWGDDSKREDHWYRWYVEDGRPRRWWVKGFATAHPLPTWRIAYRTCPEHEVMEIAEGLGITRYIYEHHGTVASADVRLISFTRGSNDLAAPRICRFYRRRGAR